MEVMFSPSMNTNSRVYHVVGEDGEPACGVPFNQSSKWRTVSDTNAAVRHRDLCGRCAMYRSVSTQEVES